MDVLNVGVDKKLHCVISNSRIRIDDDLSIGLKGSHSTALCDIARRIHHFGCIKTVEYTVVFDFDPSIISVQQFSLCRTHYIVRNRLLASNSFDIEGIGNTMEKVIIPGKDLFPIISLKSIFLKENQVIKPFPFFGNARKQFILEPNHALDGMLHAVMWINWRWSLFNFDVLFVIIRIQSIESNLFMDWYCKPITNTYWDVICIECFQINQRIPNGLHLIKRNQETRLYWHSDAYRAPKGKSFEGLRSDGASWTNVRHGEVEFSHYV